ncbi:MAG TPA: DNA primase [Clostridia bacterium]|nr:DNA primase [Clostridia bacterium]
MKGAWDSHIIEDVRDRIDIVEIISERVNLKRAGKNYVGLCPFHSERTPSFSVSPDKQMFYCFGCHVGGDVFTFLMKADGLTFSEALEYLAGRAGVRLPTPSAKDSGVQAREGAGKNGFTSSRAIRAALQFAKSLYVEALKDPKTGAAARDYLGKRGLSRGVIGTFEIGYAPDRWDFLSEAVRSKGLTPEPFVRAGLLSRRQDGSGYYDRFRGRVMFPIHDPIGRVVGFAGRVLEAGADASGDADGAGDVGLVKGPKYLNSPETSVFSKGKLLYGMHLARPHITKAKRVILTEGYMDVISAHQFGFPEAVASMGTSLTDHQVRILERLAETLYIVYDGDSAGEQAAFRALEALIGSELEVRIVALPKGTDPDEFLRSRGREGLEELMKDSKGLLDYALETVMKTVDPRTPEGKIKVAKRMTQVVSRLESEIQRSTYIEEIARKIDVDVEAIRSDVSFVRARKAGDLRVPNKRAQSGHNTQMKIEAKYGSNGDDALSKAERELVRLIFEVPDKAKGVLEELELEGFIPGRYRAIFDAVRSMLERDEIPTAGKVMDALRQVPDDREATMLSEILLEGVQYADAERVLSDCVRTIRMKRLEEKLHGLIDKIRLFERQKVEPDAGLLVAYKTTLEAYNRLKTPAKGASSSRVSS